MDQYLSSRLLVLPVWIRFLFRHFMKSKKNSSTIWLLLSYPSWQSDLFLMNGKSLWCDGFDGILMPIGKINTFLYLDHLVNTHISHFQLKRSRSNVTFSGPIETFPPMKLQRKQTVRVLTLTLRKLVWWLE